MAVHFGGMVTEKVTEFSEIFEQVIESTETKQEITHSHTIRVHVGYIYLHLVVFNGKIGHM